jgi:hypothetical protein
MRLLAGCTLAAAMSCSSVAVAFAENPLAPSSTSGSANRVPEPCDLEMVAVDATEPRLVQQSRSRNPAVTEAATQGTPIEPYGRPDAFVDAAENCL